jgi:HAD superfamily hydrolase (TIGR01490 family)
MQINSAGKVAFFDVDGTIISIKSLVSFAQYLAQNNDQDIQLPAISIFLHNIVTKLRSDCPRLELNRHYFSMYKDLPLTLVARAANKWFAEVEEKDGFYIKESVDEIKRLKNEGYFIVLVTGSFLPLLLGLKERLGVDDIICTIPEAIDGIYTGELIGNPCIGEYKRKNIFAYAIENNIDLVNSYAFGDDDSDVHMLQAVGHGVKISQTAAH